MASKKKSGGAARTRSAREAAGRSTSATKVTGAATKKGRAKAKAKATSTKKTASKKAAARKTPSKKSNSAASGAARKPRTKAVTPSPSMRRATVLARKMPLVHFPASARFEDWTHWRGLLCRAAMGRPLDPGDFGELRGRHVFFYAGPSCYYHRTSIGDALLYFDPVVEAGRDGSVSPFDSGSLEDPTPKLQPWAAKPADERWSFLRAHVAPLAGWRDRFEAWLAAAFDEPDRYLEATVDRYASGEPDRLDPPDLLEHNGTRGRRRYGEGGCGDRRAWTWEVRIADAVSFERVQVLHVPFDSLQTALDEADKMKWTGGGVPEVEVLPPGTPGSFQTLYEDCERVLRRLVG